MLDINFSSPPSGNNMHSEKMFSLTCIKCSITVRFGFSKLGDPVKCPNCDTMHYSSSNEDNIAVYILENDLKIGRDYDFEMHSLSSSKGGTTLCGYLKRSHYMKRHSPMKTVCIYAGCDAVC